MMPKNDPSAPSQRSTVIQIVRNKNNLEELTLRRRVDEYRKTLAVNMCDLEQERLDVFDFMKQLKSCDSEVMDELKHINDKLHENPPNEVVHCEITPPILPLISINTAASGEIPKRNGAFSIDVHAVESVPASMLWKDPSIITLKDIKMKSIRCKEKKSSVKKIPEKCLRKLAAAGWVEDIIETVQGKARIHKKSKAVKSNSAESDEEGDVDNNVYGSTDVEVNKQPHSAEFVTRLNLGLELPEARGRTSNVARDQPKMRPSTADKAICVEKSKLDGTKKNSVSTPQLCVMPDEPMAGFPIIIAPNGTEVQVSEKLQEALLTQRELSKLELQRQTTEILRTVVERKASKYIAKRTQRVPLSKRLKDFYGRVNSFSTGSFLPPIDRDNGALVRSKTHL